MQPRLKNSSSALSCASSARFVWVFRKGLPHLSSFATNLPPLHPQIAYWSYHGFFWRHPLSRHARRCPPANQRGEMSSRQWCVRPRSLPAPTRAPGGDCVRPLIAYRLRLSLRGRWRSATPSSALPEGTHRLNLADDHLEVTGVPFSIVSNTNADTSTRSFLDDPADCELLAKPSSALRCPHTFPRAATPVGTRALPTRRR